MKKFIASALIAFSAICFFAVFKSVHAQDITYTVQPGDSLSSIASSKLGDPNKWIDIFNLNKSSIQDPNIIYVGEVLVLSLDTATLEGASQALPIVTQGVNEQIVPSVPSPVVSHASAPVGENIYEGTVISAASKYHVSIALMNQIIICESGFNPNAYNPSGATGIAQFMYGTYYGTWNPYRTQYSIWSPIGQIYAMALKISLGGARLWQCYKG